MDRRKYRKLYREKNREHLNEQDRIYRQNNKERINEMNRQYYQKNKELIKKQVKQYSQKPEIKARIKQYKQNWEHKNPEKVKARNFKHKGKGFAPIAPNTWSTPVDWHHISPNYPYVVPLPRKVHKAVFGKFHFVHTASIICKLYGLNLEDADTINREECQNISTIEKKEEVVREPLNTNPTNFTKGGLSG